MKTTYFVAITEYTDLLMTSLYKFRRPQRNKFFPSPPGGVQGYRYVGDTAGKSQYKTFPHFNNVLYFTRGNVEDVIKYYLEEMVGYDWVLEEKTRFKGRYAYLDALGQNTAGIKVSDVLDGLGSEDLYPGIFLKVKGAALTFKPDVKEGEEENAPNIRCLVNIIRFDDSPATLRTMRIDPEPFRRYGKNYILISIQEKEFLDKQLERADTIQKDYNEHIREFIGVANTAADGQEEQGAQETQSSSQFSQGVQ